VYYREKKRIYIGGAFGGDSDYSSFDVDINACSWSDKKTG
jgi:hypothetical protein